MKGMMMKMTMIHDLMLKKKEIGSLSRKVDKGTLMLMMLKLKLIQCEVEDTSSTA